MPVDWVKTLFETNYFGVLRVTQAVLPDMRERRAGTIVNVSSVAGRLAVAGHGHYSAVKHALEAMSEALAQEVQRFGIRVAIVEPGVVVTPIFSKAKRWADPASPYFDHVRRLLLLYQKQMPHAAQPDDAARVIYEAATTSTPRLRWLVGEDANLLVAGRQRQSDEEYVAGGRAMSEEEFLDEARRRYGFTWRGAADSGEPRRRRRGRGRRRPRGGPGADAGRARGAGGAKPVTGSGAGPGRTGKPSALPSIAAARGCTRRITIRGPTTRASTASR